MDRCIFIGCIHPIYNPVSLPLVSKWILQTRFSNGDEIIFNGHLVKINAFIAIGNKILPNFTAIESFLGY